VSDEVSERKIRDILRRLGKQRVSMILQPGNVWFVEQAVVVETEAVAAALATCLIRGWVAILDNAIPTGTVKTEGGHTRLPERMDAAPVYRLTEAGWDAIQNTHTWVRRTFYVALLGLVGTVGAIVLSRGG